MRPLLTALLAVGFVGCATGRPVGSLISPELAYEPFTRAAPVRDIPQTAVADVPPLSVPAGARDRVVSVAKSLIGKPHVVVAGRSYGDDCTGLLRAAFAPIGVDLLSAAEAQDNGVTAMWRFAGKHGRIYEGGRPISGDLVFFRDTYDVNRDGRVNDGLTHVGLVEQVDSDGTVTVIHHVAKGVVRYRMNLASPDLAVSAEGKPINDWLRPQGPGAQPRLTAQLFAGFATVLPVEARLAGR